MSRIQDTWETYSDPGPVASALIQPPFLPLAVSNSKERLNHGKPCHAFPRVFFAQRRAASARLCTLQAAAASALSSRKQPLAAATSSCKQLQAAASS
jgi:hypothetical protein